MPASSPSHPWPLPVCSGHFPRVEPHAVCTCFQVFPRRATIRLHTGFRRADAPLFPAAIAMGLPVRPLFSHPMGLSWGLGGTEGGFPERRALLSGLS